MKDKEKDEVLKASAARPAVETKVALDALAVYVNEKNPLQEISIPTLAQDLHRRLEELEGRSAARTTTSSLYGRENNSGTYGYFKEHVLENKDFAAATQTLAGHRAPS